jgi:hypothetical protein
MPYKDQKKRRTYQCEYKRRQRAMGKMSNPVCQTMSNPLKSCQTLSQTMKRKAYLCPKVPNLRLPGIVFKNGFFVTDRPEEQDRIESDPLYGEEVFSWLVDP